MSNTEAQVNREQQMFRRLAGDPDFKVWLEAALAKDTDALLEQLDPPRIHQSQGRIKTIRALLKQMEVARRGPN